MTQTLTDPRPLYARALDHVVALVDAVRTDQLALPTPCAEYDVRALLGHLVATAERARVAGTGGDVLSVPVVVTGTSDDGWAAAYRASADAAVAAWADDDALVRTVTVPWGTVPGAGVVWGYLNETLVHGWDLAVATGQPTEADADLAEATLAAARGFIPAGMRGGPVPFAAPITPRAAAGPTERLANWCGHWSATV